MHTINTKIPAIFAALHVAAFASPASAQLTPQREAAIERCIAQAHQQWPGGDQEAHRQTFRGIQGLHDGGWSESIAGLALVCGRRLTRARPDTPTLFLHVALRRVVRLHACNSGMRIFGLKARRATNASRTSARTAPKDNIARTIQRARIGLGEVRCPSVRWQQC
jgi:hypothetical protein